MRKLIQDLIYRALLVGIVFVLGVTTRKTWINRHILEGFQREGRNFILGIWHNNIIYMIFPLRVFGLTVLASRSRDGTNIARVGRVFGIRTAWGSTSKGAMGGVREMLRLLRSGRNVTIMPDGPRGPRYVLQPGVTALAQRAGVPIVPLAWSGRRMIEFNSWDRMKLPLPFSRIIIYVGNPIHIAPDEKDQEAAGLKVEHAMRLGEAIVDQFAQGSRTAREPLLAEAARADATARA